MEYPSKIEITFTEGDIKKAEDYFHNSRCIVATALRRMGYRNVMVGGFGQSDIKNEFGGWEVYKQPWDGWFSASVKRGDSYDPDIVGKTLVLIRE